SQRRGRYRESREPLPRRRTSEIGIAAAARPPFATAAASFAGIRAAILTSHERASRRQWSRPPRGSRVFDPLSAPVLSEVSQARSYQILMLGLSRSERHPCLGHLQSLSMA